MVDFMVRGPNHSLGNLYVSILITLQVIFPKGSRRITWVQSGSPPPQLFASRTMQFIMMQRAKWNDKFITDLQRKPAGLGKGEVVGVRGNLFADQTGQGAHMARVIFVTNPPDHTD